MSHLTRREFVVAATAAGTMLAANSAATAPGGLVIVTWGGGWSEGLKQVADTFDDAHDVDFAWELHQGGSQNILGKIRATWPVVQYDLVTAWNPTFSGMIKEGWLETIDDVPNLQDVPDAYVMRDADGNGKVVPMSVGATFWGYRTDMVDFEITSVEDFLHPSLKGKVAIWDPTSWSFLPYVSMALEFGGSEKNIDPAFDFLKELAAAGNISRILISDVEQTNTMTTGESAISFGFSGSWTEVTGSQPVKVLSRVDGSAGLKGFLYNEGWGILKGENTELAKQFAGFSLAPENNELINALLSQTPANAKAKASEAAEPYTYAPDELDTYAYIPDYGYIIDNVNDWAQRFETEIIPLIRQG